MFQIGAVLSEQCLQLCWSHVALIHFFLSGCGVHLLVEVHLVVSTDHDLVLELQFVQVATELDDVIHFTVDCEVASVDEYLALLFREVDQVALTMGIRHAQNTDSSRFLNIWFHPTIFYKK